MVVDDIWFIPCRYVTLLVLMPEYAEHTKPDAIAEDADMVSTMRLKITLVVHENMFNVWPMIGANGNEVHEIFFFW